jgi:hypothetical protein
VSTFFEVPTRAAPKALSKVATDKEKRGFARVLDILNRGTEGSASFFDEALFDPTQRDPSEAFAAGFLKGEGSVESFGELLEKSGWKPSSPVGKFMRAALGLSLDIGLDPTTYITLGTATIPRGVLKSVGPLVKAGTAVGDIEKVLGKGGRKAAEFLIEAQAKASPREGQVIQKVLRGEDISRAEAAVLGTQSLLGLDAFGQKLLIAPKGVSFEAFDKGGKFLNYVKETPLVSPVVAGVSKAFNQYSADLKKKFPEVIEMRQRTRDRLASMTNAFRQRWLQVWDQVGDPEERKILTRILEEGNVVVGKEPYWINVTEPVERSSHIMTDLGISRKARLTDQESVDVVAKYFDEVHGWLDEFDGDGLYAGFHLKEQIRTNQKIVEELQQMRKEAAGRGEDLGQIDAALKQYKQQTKDVEEALLNEDADFNRIISTESGRTLGRGAEGTVKKLDHVRFRDRVMKFPNYIGRGSFDELISEYNAYRAAGEVTGVGSASLVWKELPLAKTELGDDFVPGLQFKPRGPSTALEPSPMFDPRRMESEKAMWEEISDFIITKPNGRRYIKVPVVVKEFVDVDKAATDMFHAAPTVRPSTVKIHPLLQFERTLAQMARRGVILLDVHSGNLVIDKKGNTRLLELGFAQTRPRNPIGVREAHEYAINTLSNLIGGNRVAGEFTRRSLDENLALIAESRYKLTYLRPSSFSKAKALVPKKLDEMRIRLALIKRGIPFNEARKVAKDAVARAKEDVPISFEQGIVRVDPEHLTRLEEEIADLAFELEEMTLRPQVAVQAFEALGQTLNIEARTARIEADLTAKTAELESARKLKKLEDPIAVTRQGRRFKDITLFDKLSPEGRAGLEMVTAWKAEITRTLIDSGFLTEEFVQGFAQRHGIEYVPHVRKGDADDLVKRFFFMIGRLSDPAFLKPRKLEGAIKEIHERGGREIFETDIGKILFARHVAVAEAVENWKYLDELVKNFGERLEPTIHVRKVGNKLEEVETFVPNKPGFVVLNEHPLFQGYQVPKEIAHDIKRVIGWARNDPVQNNFFKWMKGTNTWWKKWQLFIFPSFFLRNAGSGFWNGNLAGMNPLAFKESWETLLGQHNIEEVFRSIVQKDRPVQGIGHVAVNGSMKVRGLGITRQQLLDEFHGQGLAGRGLQGALGEIERKVWQEMADLPRAWTSYLTLNPDKNFFVQFGMRVGNWMENWQRYAGYLHFRRQGNEPEQAAALVRKYFFDVTQLNDSERAIRDYAIPFYSWTRFNLPLQVQQMILQPGKFAALGKTIKETEREFGGPAPNSRILPEWLNDNLGVRFRYNKEKRTYEYFLLRSWVPAADVQALFTPGQSFLSMLSPTLRVPAEQLLNKSALTGQPLEEYPGEPRSLLSPEAGRLAAKVPGMDPVAQLLEQTVGRPLGFVASPLEQGIEVRGRTENILRAFRAVTETKRFLETSQRSGAALGAATTLVGKSYGVDPVRYASGKIWTTKRQLAMVKSSMNDALEKGQIEKARKEAERVRRIQLELQLLESGR